MNGETFAPAAAEALPQEAAARCLRSQSYLALKNISCEMLEGVLVLRGCVPTYYLKQIAQELVSRLKDAGRIDNQIRVLPSTRG